MANERRHRDYRSFLLSQPCCCQPCVAPVIIHHHTAGETERHGKSLGGKRGKGQRANDTNGMSMCNHHHADLHDRTGLSGFFADYDKQSRRIWQDEQVTRLQRLYAMAYPDPIHAVGKSDKRRGQPGKGWSVAGVIDLLKKEARHRPAEVAAAFTEVVGLIERDTL